MVGYCLSTWPPNRERDLLVSVTQTPRYIFSSCFLCSQELTSDLHQIMLSKEFPTVSLSASQLGNSAAAEPNQSCGRRDFQNHRSVAHRPGICDNRELSGIPARQGRVPAQTAVKMASKRFGNKNIGVLPCAEPSPSHPEPGRAASSHVHALWGLFSITCSCSLPRLESHWNPGRSNEPVVVD